MTNVTKKPELFASLGRGVAQMRGRRQTLLTQLCTTLCYQETTRCGENLFITGAGGTEGGAFRSHFQQLHAIFPVQKKSLYTINSFLINTFRYAASSPSLFLNLCTFFQGFGLSLSHETDLPPQKKYPLSLL